MTPEERADNIMRYRKWRFIDDGAEVTSLIAAAIWEAVLAEYEGDDSNVARIEQSAYNKGFNSGIEEAAKVAEIHYEECREKDLGVCPRIIEQGIRMLRRPEKGAAREE